MLQQLFALHTSAAYRSDRGEFEYPGDEGEIRRHLLPWLWEELSEDTDLVVIGARLRQEREESDPEYEYEFFPVALASPGELPASWDDSRGTVQDWVSTEQSLLTWTPEVFTNQNPPPEEDVEEQTRPHVKDQVGYLSTLPGRIPSELGLVTYFRLLDRLSEDEEDAFGLADIEQFIVARVIRRDGMDPARPSMDPKFEFMEPIPDTEHREWIRGWKYKRGEDDAPESAFVQPVSVEIVIRDEGSVRRRFLKFNGESRSGRLGPELTDYWVRSEEARSWSDIIEQKCNDVTNLFARSSEAEQLIEHPDSEIRTKWRSLRLMALAQFSQWEAPGSPEPFDRALRDAREQIRMGSGVQAAVESAVAVHFGEPANYLGTMLLLRLFLQPETLAWDSDARGAAIERLQRFHEWLIGSDAANAWDCVLDRVLALSAESRRLAGRENTHMRYDEALRRAGQRTDFVESLLWAQWDAAFNTVRPEEPSPPSPRAAAMAEAWNKVRLDNVIRRLFGIRGAGETLDNLLPWSSRSQHDRYSLELLDQIVESPPDGDEPDTAQRTKEKLKAFLKRLPNNVVTTLTLPRLLTTYEAPYEWTGDGEPPHVNARAFVPNYIEKTWEGLISTPPSEARQSGVTLQLDEISHGDKTSVFSDIPLWQNLTGVGLIVHEESENKPWRVVSSAHVNLSGVRVRYSRKVGERIHAWVSVERAALPGLRRISIRHTPSDGPVERVEAADALAVLAHPSIDFVSIEGRMGTTNTRSAIIRGRNLRFDIDFASRFPPEGIRFKSNKITISDIERLEGDPRNNAFRCTIKTHDAMAGFHELIVRCEDAGIGELRLPLALEVHDASSQPYVMRIENDILTARSLRPSQHAVRIVISGLGSEVTRTDVRLHHADRPADRPRIKVVTGEPVAPDTLEIRPAFDLRDAGVWDVSVLLENEVVRRRALFVTIPSENDSITIPEVQTPIHIERPTRAYLYQSAGASERSDGIEVVLSTTVPIGALGSVVFGELLPEPLPLPVRLPLRDERYFLPFVTYHNSQLVGDDPLAGAAYESFDARSLQGGSSFSDSVYEHRAVVAPGPVHDHLKCTRLRFGQSYRVGAFVSDVAKGHPRELTTLDNPCVVSAERLRELGSNAVVDDSSVFRTYLHQRRVPVGQPRINACNLKNRATRRPAKISWPAVPADVFPLARELDEDNQAKWNYENNENQNNPEALPLLLLIFKDGEATAQYFTIRPPTVERVVLEDWLEPDEFAGNYSAALGDYFARLPEQNSSAVMPDDATDVTFDDPAALGYLFELFAWDWETLAWGNFPVLSEQVRIVRSDASGIGRYQSPDIPVICQANLPNEEHGPAHRDGTEWTLEYHLGDGTVTVGVPTRRRVQGEVVDMAYIARLEISVIVENLEGKAMIGDRHAKKFADDFAESYFNKKDVHRSGAFRGIMEELRVLPPFRLLLETPCTRLPSAGDLWEGLALTDFGDDPDTIHVVLDERAPADGPIPTWRSAPWRYIARCDLLMQQWRWQGRPVPFNEQLFTGDLNAKDFILNWEVEALAEIRHPYDTTTYELIYPRQRHAALFSESFSGRPAARYLRFGMRVHSRYAGLDLDWSLEQPKMVLARQPYTPDADGSPAPRDDSNDLYFSGPGWKRKYISYRGGKPPRPIIRAVIPLTEPWPVDGESRQADRPLASLVVILDETMFVHCGLGEDIEYEVETDSWTGLPQFGHDPLISIDLAEPPRVYPRAVGPFGYTLDTDARQSLFRKSAFVLPPPESAKAYDFAKLRFRRVCRVPSAVENGTGDLRLGDWTKPIWIQYFPAAVFGLRWPERLEIRPDGDRRLLLLRPLGSIVDEYLGQASDRYRYWVLVSLVIHDFRGHVGEEIPLRILPVRGEMIAYDLGTANAQDHYRVRLMEIQIAPHFVTSYENELAKRLAMGDQARFDDWFWDQLFPIGDSPESVMRITRISSGFQIGAPVRA